MHILILAGGFATRLWPLTEKKAKPLIPVAGKPLISFLVESLPETFPITISTNQVFAKDFENWKEEFFPHRIINIFVEDSVGETQKKGALAAVSLFLQDSNLSEPLMLLAGDNYFGFSMQTFIDAARDTPILAAYDIKDLREAKKFGVVVPKNEKQVKAFEEKPEKPSSSLVSTGAYIFPVSTLQDIIDYSKTHADDLGGIFEYFLQQGKEVEYFTFSEDWFDIGSFPAFMEANQTLLMTSLIHENVQQKGKVEMSGICIVQKNCQLENVELENSIILEGCVIKNTTLKNCLICEECIIENTDITNKMIRSESVVIRKK